MNKSFVLLDRSNNVQRTASSIVKFNFEGKEYLIYSIEENEQNDHIFVSRLVMNSEGKTFIDNILPEEKGKLNNIVYNIVILIPSEAQKGSSFEVLSSDLNNKFSAVLSMFLSNLDVQEYYHGCSVAITSKILVDSAIKYYESNLNKKVEEVVSVPTWTSPVDVTAPVPAEPINEEIKIPEPVSTPVQESVIIPVPDPVVAPIQEPIINSVQDPVIDLNVQPNSVEPISNVETIVLDTVSNINVSSDNLKVVNEPVVSSNIDSSFVNNSVVNQENQMIQENVDNVLSDVSVQQTNPQIEKLAIVSDPSLGIGVTQPNVVKNKKAGFANSKYIILGTVCLVLAIAVVVVAYFLISNMK